MTLEEVYNKAKKSYEGKPAWMWEDEGSYYAVADYHSMMGEFTDADREFAKREGIEIELRHVEEDQAPEEEEHD